jgi:hypothetical protein
MAIGRKSGVVTVRAKRESAEIEVRLGRLQQASVAKGAAAADIVLAAKVSAADREAIGPFVQADDVGTLLLLDFLGVCPRDQSLAVLRERAIAELRAVAAWPKAEFRFGDGSRPPAGGVSLNLPLGVVVERLNASN